MVVWLDVNPIHFAGCGPAADQRLCLFAEEVTAPSLAERLRLLVAAPALAIALPEAEAAA